MTSVIYTNGSGHAHAAPAFERSIRPLRRTPIQRILLVTDGTVTEILEAYTGESMRLIKLYEEQVSIETDLAGLDLPAGQPVLRRKILLQGKMSLTNFLYADSYVALDRLDDWMRRGLLESHKPIGFLLQEHRLETFREIIHTGREMAGQLGTYFNVDEASGMMSRTYRVLARLLTQAAAQCSVIGELRDGRGQRVGIAGRYDQTGASVLDDFGHHADRRGHQ
jgi:chorismate-pyruvate lyase